MTWTAPILLAVFLAIVFPLRALLQRRGRGPAPPIDWLAPRPRAWRFADALFVCGFAALLIGALLAALGSSSGPGFPRAMPGIALMLAATALVLWAQATMGVAWRTDIAPVAGGALVTDGPFRVVRNPTYVAMLAAGIATVLLAGGPLTLAGLVALWVSLLVTARFEEPPLLEAYGERYRRYTGSVGRFVPGIGRLRA